MQIARLQTIAASTMVIFAIADDDIAARLISQHEGEVFGTHRQFDLRIDV